MSYRDLDLDQTMPTVELIRDIFICYNIFKFQVPRSFLAHWGAYAIPVALSVVRRSSSIVRRVSSVSTITTRNN